jgi:hypothetical protein
VVEILLGTKSAENYWIYEQVDMDQFDGGLFFSPCGAGMGCDGAAAERFGRLRGSAFFLHLSECRDQLGRDQNYPEKLRLLERRV